MSDSTPPPEPRSGREESPHQGAALDFELPEPTRMSPGRVALVTGTVVAALAGLFVFGWLPKRQARAALERGALVAEGVTPRVDVVAPKLELSDRALTLPGSVQALQETVVYARADGYVRRWLVDIGDKATEGQLLAELDTPDLDQQLDQARAQLVQAQAALPQAEANRDYSAQTFDRYKTLTTQGLSAQADLDQRKAQAAVDVASVAVAQATVRAQEANVRRLVQMKAFARVTAPFAGTVTARTIEVGSLVTAANAKAMFRIATMSPARVFVQVPQEVAPGIRAGTPAKVTVRDYGGRLFDGTVARAAGELDPASRTMNTEVRVANVDGALLPGMYAQVSLTLTVPHRVLELPATALVNDAKGSRVVIVAGDHLHFVPIVVERDKGAAIDVASGLTGDERVVKLPSADLVEGEAVVVTPPPAAAP